MSDVESLPGCFGEYGSPQSPNGPCQDCCIRVYCLQCQKYWVKKNALKPTLERLEKLEEVLKK